MSLPDTMQSILTIAALLIGGGGVYRIVSRRDPKRGVLMLIVALVLIGNVLIWVI